MKKTGWFVLLCLLSSTASALNFFGIEYTGDSANNAANLIVSLAEGNETAVEEYLGRLKKTDSYLARLLNPDNLKIPCTYCEGKGTLGEERTCPVCEGTGRVIDTQALGYLYNKYCEALDAGETERKALEGALEAFEKRRKQLPYCEMLTGTVLQKKDGGAFLSCEDEGVFNEVFLKGIGPEFPDEGASVSGEVWLSGMYSYKEKGGKTVYVKCFAVTPWMD